MPGSSQSPLLRQLANAMEQPCPIELARCTRFSAQAGTTHHCFCKIVFQKWLSHKRETVAFAFRSPALGRPHRERSSQCRNRGAPLADRTFNPGGLADCLPRAPAYSPPAGSPALPRRPGLLASARCSSLTLRRPNALSHKLRGGYSGSVTFRTPLTVARWLNRRYRPLRPRACRAVFRIRQ